MEDPFEWSVDQVVRYLCNPSTLPATSPHCVLPDLSKLKSTLQDNDVNGSTLLTAITQEVLRDDLGIASLGQRTAILLAISSLQGQSAANAGLTRQENQSLHQTLFADHKSTPPTFSQRLTTQQDPDIVSSTKIHPHYAVATQPAASKRGVPDYADVQKQPRLREGEVVVRTADGSAKRRKIPQLVNHEALTTPAFTDTDQLHAYLGKSKMIMNEMFYSDVDNSGIINVNPQFDSDEMTLFPQQSRARGRMECLKRRMHFMFQSTPHHLDRQTLIRHPYPERFVSHKDVWFGTVIRILGQTVEVLKGDATMSFEGQKSIRGSNPVQGQHIEEDVLPLYGDSGDEADYEESLLDEMEAELKGGQHVKPQKHTLSLEEMHTILDDAIVSYKSSWEEKKAPSWRYKAYSLWEKAQGRALNHHILVARQELARLDARFEKLRREISCQTWYKKEALLGQCVSLRPTIHDQCVEEFKLALYKSKQSPQRLPKPPQRPTCVKLQANVDSDGEDIESDDQEDPFIERRVVHRDIQHDDIDPSLFTSRVAERHMSDPEQATESVAAGFQRFNGGAESDRLRHFVDDEELSVAESEDSILGPLPKKIPLQRHFAETRVEIATNMQESGCDGNSLPLQEDERQPQPYSEKCNGKEITPITNGKMNTIGIEEASSEHDEMSTDNEDVDYEDLEQRADREGLITKVLTDMNSQVRNQMIQQIQQVGEKQSMMRVKSSLIALREQHHPLEEPSSISKRLDLTCARMFLCWQMIDAKYRDEGQRLDHTVFNFVMENFTNGFKGFRQYLSRFALGSKESKLKKKYFKKSVQGEMLRQQARSRRADYEARAEHYNSSQQRSSPLLSNDCASVCINPGKEDDTPEIYINEHISRRMKPHQIEGVQFLWREIVGAGKDETAQGCLLSHTMGLGKTLQAIALLATVAEASTSADVGIVRQIPEDLRVQQSLVLCPSGLVSNWKNELRMWIPDSRHPSGPVYSLTSDESISERYGTTERWNSTGGILVTSYDLFRNIVKANSDKSNGKAATREQNKRVASLSDAEKQKLESWIIDGPRIIIADEGHKMKNVKSDIGSAALRLRSHHRVALTGSPLANNLGEYYALINWVAPGFLGDATEFRNVYQNPIEAGIHSDSSRYEQRRSMKKLHALKDSIADKVHRKDITALKHDLEPKTEFVLMMEMTWIQRALYKMLVTGIQYSHDDPTKAKTFGVMSMLKLFGLICAHPEAYFRGLKIAQEQAAKAARKPCKDIYTLAVDTCENEDCTHDHDEAALTQVASDLQTEMLEFYNEHKRTADEDLALSSKAAVIYDILRLCESINDQVLVFSHRLATLDYLEAMLKNNLPQLRVMRLDGETKIKQRQAMTEQFNDGLFDVFLISTGAGGVGLNITGANRVILVDFDFNPQHEEQAIGRAYRIGQQKPVFVYHLINSDSYEKSLHNQTIFKQQLTARVVDKKNPLRAAQSLKEWISEPKDVEQESLDEFHGKDLVLDELLSLPSGKAIRALTTVETLHREDEDNLTPAEIEEAQQMAKDEVLRRSNHSEWQRRQGYAMGDSRSTLVASIMARHTPSPFSMAQFQTSDAAQQVSDAPSPGGLQSVLGTEAKFDDAMDVCVAAPDGQSTSRGTPQEPSSKEATLDGKPEPEGVIELEKDTMHQVAQIKNQSQSLPLVVRKFSESPPDSKKAPLHDSKEQIRMRRSQKLSGAGDQPESMPDGEVVPILQTSDHMKHAAREVINSNLFKKEEKTKKASAGEPNLVPTPLPVQSLSIPTLERFAGRIAHESRDGKRHQIEQRQAKTLADVAGADNHAIALDHFDEVAITPENLLKQPSQRQLGAFVPSSSKGGDGSAAMPYELDSQPSSPPSPSSSAIKDFQERRRRLLSWKQTGKASLRRSPSPEQRSKRSVVSGKSSSGRPARGDSGNEERSTGSTGQRSNSSQHRTHTARRGESESMGMFGRPPKH